MSEKKQVELIPQQGECVVGKFLGKDVRKTFHEGEWWFSVVDVVGVLTENDYQNARNYWKVLKTRLKDEGANELVTDCNQLKLPAEDGKMRETDCVNVEGILRIVQSIPSQNAEPFKKWLAKTGFERIKERENPHLAIKRALLDYELQGRSKKWIQTRIQGIITRNKLTDEWKNRGVQEGMQYANLTDAISEGTFGVKTKEHKQIKSLAKHHSLRDNMSEVELIFQMLGEATTIDITRERNVIGYNQNFEAAKDGGESAGEARKAYESRLGKSVVTSESFLNNIKKENPQLTTEQNNDFEKAIDVMIKKSN